MNSTSYRHLQAARDYATAVLNGSTDVCKWVRLAVERQQRDLQRQKKKDFSYRFDEAAAERVCLFISKLPHVKGPKAGEKIQLDGWQCFVLTTVFGWVNKKTGSRRFRLAYEEVPRGNAKSTKLAGVALYALTCDGEGGAEVYSAATTREQAKAVWGVAKTMARRTPGLKKKFGLEVLANNLSVLDTGSKFEPLSSDFNSLDGLNIHVAVVDELHAHKTREVYDVLETGMGKRNQPLMFIITTAGSNRAGICYEVRTYATKVLEGLVEDETFFGIIYTVDDGDEWTDPAAWKKANPGWGTSVDADHIARLAAKAMQIPSAQNNFKTKHLNMWVNADMAWMDMKAWDRCSDRTLKIEDFKGQPCITGLDLASKVDICAKVRLFWREVDGKTHYYAFGRYYLPEDAITDGRNSQYSGWNKVDLLVTTSGDVTDFSVVEEELLDDAEQFDLREVPYDPSQATHLAQRLSDKGLTMVEIRATVGNFSQPMKELDALVRSGRFHHDGDPVLAWMVSNVVCHLDKKDNIYPTKERPENKIDGVVALIMALGRAMVADRQTYLPGVG